MVHADLSFKGETHVGSDRAPERPSDVKSLLHILTNEIEHARVRQDGALQELERHIRTLEAAQSHGTSIEWDQASADALAALYDHRNSDAMAGFQRPSSGVPAYAPHELHDVYQRMEALESEISRALHDLAQRRDLPGLRDVEGQVRDLTSQLDEVKGQLQRLEAVELLVRDIAWQVSDERLSKLVRQGTTTAHDLADMDAAAAHHEDLRQFITETINDWRDAEARASETARDLAHERHEMLAQLIETSIVERRQAEVQAMGVLDTLQEALVNVLDRIETLEASMGQMAPHAAPPAYIDPHRHASSQQSHLADVIAEHDGWARGPAEVRAPHPVQPTAEPMTLTIDASIPPHDVTPQPTATKPAVAPEVSAPQRGTEQSRRDMLLEVHRAKLKASVQRVNEPAASVQAAKTPRKASPTGRLPGGSTTLLAAALALVVAINGGLLLFGRKDAPVPTVTIEPLASAAPSGEDSAPQAAAAAEHAEEHASGHVAAPAQVQPDPPPASQQPNQFGYGYYGNAIEETQLPATDAPNAPPRGMTVEASPQTGSQEALAASYENQVLAGLSGDLGVAASQTTPSDMLPEKAGRVDAALTVEEPSREEVKADAQPVEAEAKPQLDLPPLTVGPQSLRLAAANGNAAAEFEVATRIAEGKGTTQDPKEALRWYQRSASRGFVQAQYRVGTFYERGLAVDRDLPRAMVWYQRAAEQGNVKAMHNLAVLSAGGVNGNPDYKAALNWFTKAANHGLADSQYNVAVLYENGLGPSADRIVAYKWYSLAAKGGDKDAAERRDALKASLSANERKAAEGLIAAFRPEMPDKLANDPLAALEAWKKEASNQVHE